MVQVASCEQACNKNKLETNSKPPEQTMILFKMYTFKSEFDRYLKHMVSYHRRQSGLLVFLVGEFGTSENFMQKWLFGKTPLNYS